MPELPEVQTIVNGLRKKVLGKQISEILEHRKNTVVWHAECVDFGKIVSIDRRGKYIIIHLSNNLKLIVHLRMTGKLIFESDLSKISLYARAEIVFEDNTKLIFDDVRTFGKIEVMEESEMNFSISKLGVEPLEKEFNSEYLEDKINRRVAPIKNILLDQSVIAGIGNIYASEILFRAKIDPTKRGNELNKKEIAKIVLHTKAILTEAIKCNGTTISDYRSVEDKTGDFQNFLQVYGKEYCECGSKISRIKQAGRSTFFCNKCQRK
jgi:formamidopyrimidine-DNA glycosylase